MLSVLLFGIGTAYAVYGVADDVPGQDLTWPVICTKTAAPAPAGFPASSLNTNWAISNLSSTTRQLNCSLYTWQSVFVNDFVYDFTQNEVVPDDCAKLVVELNATGNLGLVLKNTDIITGPAVPGTPPSPSQGDYYAGYVICQQVGVSGENVFMNNIYLVDAPLGLASGFNGPTEENGAGTSNLAENNGGTHFAAHDLWLRYYLNNDPTLNANTWNWFIIQAGRNQYGPLGGLKYSTRLLSGILFDENEHSQSINIAFPYELNIINVASILPGAPSFFNPKNCSAIPTVPPSPPCIPTFPKAGYVHVVPKENVTLISGGGTATFALEGTCNYPSGGALCTESGGFYGLVGWSYQRVQASSILGDFDVIHPLLRTYCSNSVFGGSIGSGTGNTSNSCTCAVTSGPVGTVCQ